jgi:hypothetical protein
MERVWLWRVSLRLGRGCALRVSVSAFVHHLAFAPSVRVITARGEGEEGGGLMSSGHYKLKFGGRN